MWPALASCPRQAPQFLADPWPSLSHLTPVVPAAFPATPAKVALTPCEDIAWPLLTAVRSAVVNGVRGPRALRGLLHGLQDLALQKAAWRGAASARAKCWPMSVPLVPSLTSRRLPALGIEPALAIRAGSSRATPGGQSCLTVLKPAPCSQVECNSKLDPTSTTFLKVRPSSHCGPSLRAGPAWGPTQGGSRMCVCSGSLSRCTRPRHGLGPLLSSPSSLPCRWQTPGGSPRSHR